MRGNADSAEVCCHCVLTKSSMSADQSADSMPHADSIRLFLCGDVMTGTREQSGPASSQRSHLARTCIGDARTYVELAERVNGAIPSPTEFDYIWGRENPSEGTDRGESRNVANGDPAEHRLEQEAQVRELYEATQASGHELLLEIIPPKDRAQADTVYRSLKQFYNLGIKPEWWKLESMTAAQWRLIDELIAERDPYCRGVLLLGLNAPVERLVQGFKDAARSTTCRGFAVGRTIFEKPSLVWLAGEIDDKTLISRTRETFESLIRLWREAHNEDHRAGQGNQPNP